MSKLHELEIQRGAAARKVINEIRSHSKTVALIVAAAEAKYPEPTWESLYGES